MNDLQHGMKDTVAAFDEEMFGISVQVSKHLRGSYLAALDGAGDELKYDRQAILKEGLSMFENTFGFPSKSFIAPNYVWDDTVEMTLADAGVSILQGAAVKTIATKYGGPVKRKRLYQGQTNRFGQVQLVRNVEFEPSSNPGMDWVGSSLKAIENAFKWKKPAIISTHRVNFTGYINPGNRDRNLKSLDNLLKNILNFWPDVEFITSDKLGKIILNQ